MPVLVTTTVQVLGGEASVHHAGATYFMDEPNGGLVLRDADGKQVAMYAPGCWASATKLPDPAPNFTKGGDVNAAVPVTLEAGEHLFPASTSNTLTVTEPPHMVLTVNPSRFDDQFVRLVRESLRVNNGGNVTVSFGDADDDGLAGVREPVAR